MSDLAAVEPFTPDEARCWLDGVRAAVDGLRDRIIEGWRRRADDALGFESWEAMMRAEIRPQLSRAARRELVGELRDEGMSTRAIGAAVGATDITVRRDLEGATNVAPDRVTGLDGKSHPASRPRTDDLGLTPTERAAYHQRLIDDAEEVLGDRPEPKVSPPTANSALEYIARTLATIDPTDRIDPDLLTRIRRLIDRLDHP